MKKLFPYILLIVILATTLNSSVGIDNVQAAVTGADLDAQRQGVRFVSAYDIDSTNIGVEYGVKEGDLIYITINQKAQTKIKYQTAGWLVRKNAVCSDQPKPTKASRETATCSPAADGKAVELPKSAFEEFTSE
ncbi:hypothetical protein [Paenibacillus sinopodophylli]|uniref:hypothetical protein n=1 Tax=Paenibacillus sinopodophylli TaxID=1837342 RepID=UPI00110CBD81|nr:hypothetical protein [Paenibacillus sinopodophylli]